MIIGRSLSSADYGNGDSAGYNTLTIPVVDLTAYTTRETGNRLGWHASSANASTSVAGDETSVTAEGVAILGLAEGTYDLLSEVSGTDSTFNGLSVGTTTFGGGSVLATVGSNTLAAYWAVGSAPGNPAVATVATFPGPRLLFNVDNDPSSDNSGVNDLNNMTATGTQAFISAIDFATPLTAVPEPSATLLGLAGFGLLIRRRR